MRHVSVALLGLLVLSLAAAQEKKADAPRWTPEGTFKIKDVGNVQVSPDGKRVAFTVRQAAMDGEKSEYLTHIHVANADGSEAFQLTQGDKSCDNPQWSPDGERIAFASSRSGKSNLWLIRLRGGEAERLTDVKSSVGAFKFSPDGKSIAFTLADPRTPEEEKTDKEKNDARVVDESLKLNRLHVIPVAKDKEGKREARLLTKGNFNVGAAFDWSPDGKTIVFSHTPTPRVDDWTRADLSTVDVAGGEVKPLVATEAAESTPLYSPDGKWVVFLQSDTPVHWARNMTVKVVTASGGTPRELAETFDRSPNLVGWSADGKKVYYTEAHGTTSRLCALPLEGQPEVLGNKQGVLGAVHLNATRTAFGFNFQSATEPAEAFVSAAERFNPAKVSAVNTGLSTPPLGRTEVQRWKSTDGMEIEGLLTLPPGFEQGKRVPLLLVIHGGPTGVFTQTYTGGPALYPIAIFADRGYAVLRCNPRGSSGYGQKFRYANYKDWGGGDYKDLMAGVDRMVEMGIADPDRLGVMGWSYGGYMTSWVITQTKRFKAASVGAGVTNLMSFTGTADIPGFLPDYFGAEPWDDNEIYRKHSAMFNVKGVTTPTLIQHGEKDERVPISQGYELYNALKRQKCEVKMVVYPRTPHGPQEPKLLLDIMKRNLEWFDRYVGADRTGAKTE
jgi:dipeptidyl aminopeptidase/acylaminoacyl peptidase